ncbi:unnamed protein product [Pleuronectes platessa]|uniref:Uncharacterized protein n=1 Tax=Pleuronectes platessa TaxID=8262 RepID=A0A9N7VW06_PLEPL|nr:unnamed protein product [Pleuronectes platessa]
MCESSGPRGERASSKWKLWFGLAPLSVGVGFSTTPAGDWSYRKLEPNTFVVSETSCLIGGEIKARHPGCRPDTEDSPYATGWVTMTTPRAPYIVSRLKESP